MKKLLLIAPLFLAGCGGYYSVRVPHRVPGSVEAARPALGRLYLVLKRPGEGLLEKSESLSALAGEQLPDMDLHDLGSRTAKALRGPGSRVCAFVVEKAGGGPGDFAARFEPTGLLVVSLKRPALSYAKEERTVVRNDKKKGRQTVKTSVWKYSASLGAEVHLLSWPDKAVIDNWAEIASVSEDRFDKNRDLENWYVSKEENLFRKLASAVGARYAGRRVDRFRPLFKIKDDKDSEKAVSLARSGKWDEAVSIWSGRASSGGGWRDLLGLAVASEVSGEYEPAMERYKEAQAAASGDKQAKPVRWGEIYRDLENAMAAPAAMKCDRSWFGVKTAVLPFSDQTTSIDGPELLRQLLFDRLKAAGYDLVPLETTDDILRRHGYSDGGQLGAAKPSALAGWLGADRLIFADISDYGEIMAGIYNRRMVAGSARLWEKGSGEVSFEESVVRVRTEKNLLGGLAGQLARGMVERLKKKPLGYEAGIFSRRLSGNLPVSAR